ncbi:MAG: hypothetical protein AAF773_05160 [Cyanobacteria bacterium P01_D01_bin.115]
MKTSICTSRVARSAETEPPQRWTLRAGVVEQPLGCVADHFFTGFLIGEVIYHQNVGYREVLGFGDVLPEDVHAALCDAQTPPVLAYLYASTGSLYLPMSWLDAVVTVPEKYYEGAVA